MKAVQFVEHPLIIIDPPPLIRAERKEVKRLRVDRNEQSEINEILLLLLKWSVLLHAVTRRAKKAKGRQVFDVEPICKSMDEIDEQNR